MCIHVFIYIDIHIYILDIYIGFVTWAAVLKDRGGAGRRRRGLGLRGLLGYSCLHGHRACQLQPGQVRHEGNGGLRCGLQGLEALQLFLLAENAHNVHVKDAHALQLNVRRDSLLAAVLPQLLRQPFCRIGLGGHGGRQQLFHIG